MLLPSMGLNPPSRRARAPDMTYGHAVFGWRPVALASLANSVEGTSLALFDRIFGDDEACLQHVFDMRFGQGQRCPKCRRPAFWTRRKGRRCFTARCCSNAEIYPLAGTLFGQTRVPLRDLFLLLLHFTNSKVGFSASLARRLLGISHRAAFELCDRIRIHLALLSGRERIGGPGQHVFVDEALLQGVLGAQDPSGKPRNKAIVLALCTKQDLHSTVIPDRRAGTIIPLLEHLVRPGSTIVTDGFASYRCLAQRGWHNEVVNHHRQIFVNENGACQAQVETYWRHLKRTLRLTYLRVDRENLWKYMHAFNFVYNRRSRSRETFWDAISTFPAFPHKPLPWREMDLELGAQFCIAREGRAE